MPSPVGHALGGLLVGLAVLPRSKRFDPTDQTYPTDQTFLAWCAAAACAPDIDFLWGRHAMETHSVGAAILAGLIAFVIAKHGPRKGRPQAPPLRFAVACTLAWLSHVLFDWLGSDDFPPLGVMALWPFTHDFYFAHAYIFDAISRRYHLPGFWAHNVRAVVKEVILLAPPTAILAWWRLSRRRR